MKKIRIVGNGTIHGTKVEDVETGEEINNITKLIISELNESNPGPIRATIEFVNVEIDIVAEISDEKTEKCEK